MRIEEIVFNRGYKVTEDGRLLNPSGKIIGCIGKNYHGTSIRVKGEGVSFSTHRLQAFQKYGQSR